jgi:hypothetical protein
VTRFDATTEDERRKLFAEAISAHRERGSPFLTVEVDPESNAEGADPLAGTDDGGEDPRQIPWLQVAEETVNADCTDAELDRLTELLEAYPAFRIDGMESPDEAEGTNVRITARADANRLSGFLERAFREVYGMPAGYRAWVVEV